MKSVFIELINMSITAGIVACAVILLRFPLKKAPKVFSYALWAVVLFRLLCPFAFESEYSLLPANTGAVTQDAVFAQGQAPQWNFPPVDATANGAAGSVNNAANTMGTILNIAACVWVAGVVVLLGYSVISYIRLKRRMENAVLIRGNIYKTDRINTPFVLGFIKPKIYLPIGTEDFDYIIKHEQTHIRRCDHLIKPLGFLALALHWFNPIIWLSYFLMCKDMEMSCDESVLKRSGDDIRKHYSGSLLDLSVKQNGLLSPLAFGESSTKARVKNVLCYKKRTIWISVAAVIAVLGVTMGFAMDRTPPAIIPDDGSEDEITANDDLRLNDVLRLSVRENKEPERDNVRHVPREIADAAGVWVNGKEGVITLNSDGTLYHGTVYNEFVEDGITYEYVAADFLQHDDGHYTWRVNLENYDGPNGFAVWFYPVGVEVVYANDVFIPTDTEIARLYAGHDFMPDMTDEIYYKK